MMIRSQKVILIMEWFSPDLVQWPRYWMEVDTRRGIRAVKIQRIRVGRKSVIKAGITIGVVPKNKNLLILNV